MSLAAPGLPHALGSTIDRCLQKDPAARFSNGEELAASLAPALDRSRELPAPLRNWLAAAIRPNTHLGLSSLNERRVTTPTG